ncbi:DeoR/GlpR transcriptional regulator, partial [Acinetobacter baumannii]|nr:DeoR/GlpR transcriptional regulator [Acinetobacter baumannii]
MLKLERHQKILDLLNAEQKVIASDLSQRFNVSEDTIRRDLKDLDSQGLLKRVHSGALRVGPPITNFNYRETVASEQKTALAHKALPFLKEESVIIIDGSTTNLALAKEIPQDFRATIIT